jgi:hypothetical protein
MAVVRRVALLVFVVIIGVLYMWHRAEDNEERARKELAQAREAESHARELLAKSAPRGQGVFLSDDEIAALKRAGLADPVNQLRSDLGAHGSLIPIPGVVGGTMGFYDRDGIVLLPGHYVYAPGDDGHILVHALLSYDVQPGGKITWKLIEAKKD